jgi:hypothetical protein
LPGGELWRLDHVLEFVYGYGVLERFGLEGRTQFFQSRLQRSRAKVKVAVLCACTARRPALPVAASADSLSLKLR